MDTVVFAGRGRDLKYGDKVSLRYLDPALRQRLTEADATIGELLDATNKAENVLIVQVIECVPSCKRQIWTLWPLDWEDLRPTRDADMAQLFVASDCKSNT